MSSHTQSQALGSHSENPPLPLTADQLLTAGADFHRMGDVESAVAMYRRVLDVDPRDSDAHHLLGVVALQIGDPTLAISLISQAISLGPAATPFHTNLALAFAELERSSEAIESLQRALMMDRTDPTIYDHLGDLLRRTGQQDDAAAMYRCSLSLRPTVETYNKLTAILQDLNRFDEAVETYRGALELPHHQETVHSNLGTLLADQGMTKDAERHLQTAISMHPDNNDVIALATLLPVVYSSVDELAEWRERYASSVNRIVRRGITIDPAIEPVPSLFRLCYQGCNDVELNRSVSSMFTSPHHFDRAGRATTRVRIGFISSFFCDHTIGDLMKGFVAHLSRDKFEVVVFTVGSCQGPDAEFFKEKANEYIVLGSHVPDSIATIQSTNCDVLFYSDIGMNPITNALACSRLAPVQCVTWGHPVTTGMPTIDYFISSELLETPDAEQHYSETLIRLNKLPAYYHRPQQPEQKESRTQFGLPEDKRIYGCPQSLFKIHPEFDELIGRILEQDQDGIIVLIEGQYSLWGEQLKNRFARSIPSVLEQIRFLPRMGRNEFLSLITTTDVMLDPIHFGAGNTAYQSLALGVPIVTWPSEFMRGRVVNACYRQMGVSECIAMNHNHYVELALKVAQDREFRDSVSRRILDRCDRLFEDITVVQELESFLLTAVAGV